MHLTLTPLHMWWYLPDHGACVCVPAKCGGSAFYRKAFNITHMKQQHLRSRAVEIGLLTGMGPFTPEQIQHYYSDAPKHLAVRHPVERFASLWRDKCRDGDDNIPWMQGWAPDKLLNHIRAFPLGNGHWVPQYLYRVPGTSLIPSIQLLKALGHEQHIEHETRRNSDDPPMPVDGIETLYKDDMRLLHDVTHQRPAANVD